MKLQYLGTAAAEGVPGLFCDCQTCRDCRGAGGKNIRTRSQALVDDRLLLDFPPDTYLHALQFGLKLHNVESCLITHSHSDHLYPNDVGRRKPINAHYSGGPLTWYATRSGYEKIMQVIRSLGLEDGTRVRACLIEEPFQSFAVENYTITPMTAAHAVQSDPVFYGIQSKGKALLYAHDSGWFPEETWTHLANAGVKYDCVSLDCTAFRLTGWRKTHMDLETCVEVKKKLISIGAADKNTLFVLNHFSHNAVLLHEEMEAMAAREGFLVSWDGMELEF